MPRRTTPIICTDLNDDLDGRRWENDDDTPIGDLHGRSGHAGKTFADILAEHSLAATNTFGGIGDTFFSKDGERRHSSRIDFICAPKSMMDDTESETYIPKKAAEMMQMIPDTEWRDHLPIILKWNYAPAMCSEGYAKVVN